MLKKFLPLALSIIVVATLVVAEPPSDDNTTDIPGGVSDEDTTADNDTGNITGNLKSDVAEEETDYIFSFLVTCGLVIPIVMLVSFIYTEYSERRDRRERLQRYRSDLSRQALNSSLQAEVLRLHDTQSTARVLASQPKRQVKPSITTFKMAEKPKEVREFAPGDGLFELGIKKFKVPSYEKQVEMIHELSEVKEYNPTSKEVMLDLGKYGEYLVEVRMHPKAYRVEKNGKVSWRNPYIHDDNFSLCLGTGQTLYERCYNNNNYAECVRILIQILKSRHGSGYRKWSDCGL